MDQPAMVVVFLVFVIAFDFAIGSQEMGAEDGMVCMNGMECKSVQHSTYGNGTEVEFSKASMIAHSVVGSLLVGLTGVIPLIWLPKEGQVNTEDKQYMNRLLSFAAGALLGDVFLHILPESWSVTYDDHASYHRHAMYNGLLILCGIIFFHALEMILSYTDDEKIDSETSAVNVNCNNNIKCGEDAISKRSESDKTTATQKNTMKIKATGYLNLVANFMDNFTHGLAIGGSFLVGRKFGIMTTLAILLHEVPHEFGDFAILLRSGFNRSEAAKNQLKTASGGLIGTFFSQLINAGSVWWILPFTAGGFLHIALCTIIPDLMKENNSKMESLFQITIMIFAICVMGIVGLEGIEEYIFM